MKLNEITSYLESIAPLGYQESYDNSGIQVGLPGQEVHAALITLDVTEDVIDEAIKKKCNLIIAHHPLIFSAIKKITGKNYVERVLIQAIKNDIAIYACHTNLDSIAGGVNAKICEKLGLKNCKILKPLEGNLKKLATFIPTEYAQKVREAVFEAGAGHISKYDSCSYNSEGLGSFKGGKGSNPFAGQKGVIHYEKEIKFETIFPSELQDKIIKALTKAHPYEEVAYDIYPLVNQMPNAGMGMIGETLSPEVEEDFLKGIKKTFKVKTIRHTKFKNTFIKKVAVCGGSGSFMLRDAIAANADIFVTSDFKYHQFFDAEGRIVIADIGHYESEQFTKELFYELLIKKFPTFALRLSEIDTNPVNYF